MRCFYLDSSALVKHYNLETGTPLLERILGEVNCRHYISRLALVEAHSCFARLTREGTMTMSELDGTINRLYVDVKRRRLKVLAVTSRRLDEESMLLRTHALNEPLRTLDAIQFATAISLDRQFRLEAFVMGDKRLLKSAAKCGLTVIEAA